MSKTGGGRGTNQHRIRGVSRAAQRASESDVRLNKKTASGAEMSALLAEYPTFPSDYQAVLEPEWDDLSGEMVAIRPRGRDRAVSRYVLRESTALFNDARLEGFAFTEPEIATLLNGGHVAGHTEGEEAQVAGMKGASDLMLSLVQQTMGLEPSQSISDALHVHVGTPLGLKSVAFRGDQREQYEGPRVRLGGGEIFRALDARLTPSVIAAGLLRIAAQSHPVARAMTWAAFATYQQFYLDGNKRTARYVMNAVLMSHGFDAISIPERLKAQYEDALVLSYRTGNLTPHIRFLFALYNDE